MTSTTGPASPTPPSPGKLPTPPKLTGELATDAAQLSRYLGAGEEEFNALPPRAARTPAQQHAASVIHQRCCQARHEFLSLNGGRVYNELTSDRTRLVGLDEIAFAAAERYPGLTPTREQADADLELPQTEKSSREVDQGIFFAHVLGLRESGEHLMRAMLTPTGRAIALRAEFQQKGYLDLGHATVHRDGHVAFVTICNQHVLNAEDDRVVRDLETAVDLALLDDQVAVGVLRGSILSHPRYQDRRAFGSGINLTHLHDGKITFTNFMLRRELGYIRKLMNGLRHDEAEYNILTPAGGKPWIGAIDTFAIGGAMQIALVLDWVVAGSDAYFALPALKEGIVPGAANLRLGRLAGSRVARRMIFTGQKLTAVSPEASTICDEVVEPETVDMAVAAAADRLDDPAVLSNRRMNLLAEESDDTFRSYMSSYALEQATRLHSRDVIAKLEQRWMNRRNQFH